jgi:hypothetical protein
LVHTPYATLQHPKTQPGVWPELIVTWQAKTIYFLCARRKRQMCHLKHIW